MQGMGDFVASEQDLRYGNNLAIIRRQATHRKGSSLCLKLACLPGVILLYDLERRSIRNLGVLRNFDTGIALNADSTTRIQHARLFGITEDEEFKCVLRCKGTISNSAVVRLPETL